MRVFKITVGLAACATSVTAFYPYIINTGAAHKVHVADQISKGFAIDGMEDGLTKVNVQKRAISRRDGGKLSKRVNDFQIEKGKDPSEANSAAIDQDGTDFSYFAEVTFGSEPGETVYMLLDTGSSSTWVMGTKCTTKACTTHSTFGDSDSTSLQIGSKTFSIGYNTGEVEGSIVTDQVSIAGVTVEMDFGQANTTSDDFDDYPMDGIMGLGRDSTGSGLQAPTFLQVLQKQKSLKANVIGIHLDRHSDGNADGEITLGGTDDSKYVGDLNYISTTGDIRDWKIPADDIQVDGESISVTGRDAIIDTGTSYMFVPPEDAKKIFAKIEGSEVSAKDPSVYNVPCDTTTSIALVFNKVAYSIQPKDYVGPSNNNGGKCYTHIIGQSAADDDGSWLLGDTFLKNVYSVFDMDESRIGFGSKETSESSSSSSSSAASSTSSASASASSSPSTTMGDTSKSSSAASSSNSDSSASSTHSGSTSPSSTLDIGLTRPTNADSSSAGSPATKSTGGTEPTAESSTGDASSGQLSKLQLLSLQFTLLSFVVEVIMTFSV